MSDLIPGIVQDAKSGRVLMLGYLNDDALRLTNESGFVHFWSRSRNELWKKGETSGNTLRMVDIQQDCDGDAFLITAEPAGPTCHTGEVSCFDAGRGSRVAGRESDLPRLQDPAPPGAKPVVESGSAAAVPSAIRSDRRPPYPSSSAAAVPSPRRGDQLSETLAKLWNTIQQRRAERPEGSYTVKLLEGGVDLTGRKVLEEAGEILVAAKDHAAGSADDQRVSEEAADLLYHLLVLLAERDIELADVMAELDLRAG